jgi:hypothetical protein
MAQAGSVDTDEPDVMAARQDLSIGTEARCRYVAKVLEPAIAENGDQFRRRLRRIAASGHLTFAAEGNAIIMPKIDAAPISNGQKEPLMSGASVSG